MTWVIGAPLGAAKREGAGDGVMNCCSILWHLCSTDSRKEMWLLPLLGRGGGEQAEWPGKTERKSMRLEPRGKGKEGDWKHEQCETWEGLVAHNKI